MLSIPSLVSTKRLSTVTSESLNCAHSRVATIIMPSCPCQLFSAQAVHVLLSSSVPGTSRPTPHLGTNFFSNWRRCSVSSNNHAADSLFARPCHVCNRNGRYSFLAVFGLAAGPEPLTAFACALIIYRWRSSTNTSVVFMHCSWRTVKSTEACPWTTSRNISAASFNVKLGTKRWESSKRNCYIICPRMIRKSIIIIKFSHVRKLPFICCAVFLCSSLFTQKPRACCHVALFTQKPRACCHLYIHIYL